VNPVTGKRENRNRIPRAMVGFANAVLLTGDSRYTDAWRGMMDAVNRQARVHEGRTEYPTMHGAAGWYGWQPTPWSVGALELWYLTQRADDRARVQNQPWLEFLAGSGPDYPVQALRRDLETVEKRTALFRADRTPPERRLADNMLNWNPATVGALTHLMMGGLVPGREGGLLHARLRYFDPVRRRVGVPPDVAALVTRLGAETVTVTLVNVHPTEARRVTLQGGAYGEHRIVSVDAGQSAVAVGGRSFEVELRGGSGATLELRIDRYALPPTVALPWQH
jgi:hypothetical protein